MTRSAMEMEMEGGDGDTTNKENGWQSQQIFRVPACTLKNGSLEINQELKIIIIKSGKKKYESLSTNLI